MKPSQEEVSGPLSQPLEDFRVRSILQVQRILWLLAAIACVLVLVIQNLTVMIGWMFMVVMAIQVAAFVIGHIWFFTKAKQYAVALIWVLATLPITLLMAFVTLH